MDAETIQNAYGPFVAALREGGFVAPTEGWSAELVAAHVSRNNDLISEAAEQIIAGEEPSYDNSAAVEDAELGPYADLFDGLGALADAVETSARRLAAAWAALGEVRGTYLLPALIRDAGTVVNEEPIPIRKFIEGNASFHLDLHFAQLKALRQVTVETPHAPPTAAPPTEFDTYQLVLLCRPENLPEADESTGDRLQAQHLGHLAAMREAGHLKVAGFLDDQPDDSWRGICLYQATSLQEAHRLAELDPAVRAGVLSVEVMTWYTPKGALDFPGW